MPVTQQLPKQRLFLQKISILPHNLLLPVHEKILAVDTFTAAFLFEAAST